MPRGLPQDCLHIFPLPLPPNRGLDSDSENLVSTLLTTIYSETERNLGWRSVACLCLFYLFLATRTWFTSTWGGYRFPSVL